jgi:V-type H+-transporting ATPase subunit a
MKHGTLVLPTDRAREFVDLIGARTNMQFEDMNSRDMHRPYKKFVQRIDEMERLLRFLTDEVERIPSVDIVKERIDDFLAHSEDYKLDIVEQRLKSYHADFVQFKENNSELIGKRNAALEERYVVQTASAHIGHRSSGERTTGGVDNDQFEYSAARSLLEDEDTQRRGFETMFSNIAGVIPQSEQDRFARSLFRATRGNTFTHFQQIFEPMQDPKTGKAVAKAVFVIYFQDHRGSSMAQSAMAERVHKICQSFGVNTYPWPGSAQAAEQRRQQLHAQVADEDRLLKDYDRFVFEAAQALVELPRPGANSLIEEWRLFCMKEKAIYCTLNMFEGNMNLRANCWYPQAEEDQIRALLISASARNSGQSSAMLVSDRSQPRKMPPTYIRENQFTLATQTLINLYGLPRYQEANPMLLSLVTFPFLFGVMYGDVGHGLLLFLFGLYVVWKPEEFKSVSPIYYGRYMICMMGFFGIYAGFLYNDFFSVGLDLFGSRWKVGQSQEVSGAKMEYFVADYDARNMGEGAGPYPFGLDPAWHGATNELIFANSLKMKISVILGVTQMIVGLLLRFANAIHESNAVDFFCECCPMMVFMICFFGFMDYMILYKWVTALENPPSIINSLIAMGMWQTDPEPMFGHSLPKLLMALTMLTVPWMLIPKPLIIHMKMKAAAQAQANGGHHGHGGPGAAGLGHGQGVPLDLGEEPKIEDEEDEHQDFGEVMIHQVIETIEYVLGTVSHTASYLRLWALSLAHQQLSFVFFQKTILGGMAMSFPFNVIMIFIMFAVWFMITLGVLMGMDVLECVLHVLRLHWIEFNSKFYKADGHGFMPYRHKDIVDDKEAGF